MGLLCDEHVGIVSELQEVPRAAGAPDFFQYAARACDTRAFTHQQNFRNSGGASTDPEAAAAKAVGEAVERYCAAVYDVNDLPLVTRREADFPCLAPARLALYRAAQYADPGFQFVPFDDDTPARWVPAFNATTGSLEHVPAPAVFVPYFYYQGSGEAPVMEPISTGLACGRSPLEAALGAVCEVVERDAFTITWQAMIAPPGLDPAGLDPRNRDRVERFRTAGFEVRILDITTDLGVPAIMTVLLATSPERAALVFAAACAPDPADAVRKALEELEHTRRYSQQIMDRLPRLEVRENHDNVVDQLDHLNFWCDHRNADRADFLSGGGPADLRREVPGRDDGERFRHIVGQLAAAGHDVLLLDLTTPDVASAGFTVVRAIVPGLHPLYMGHRYRALGGSRLWEVPQRLGHPGIVAEDNPAPHPFP
ncbi:YcaO-like family protein [Pseudonocardia sp. T1-2H]|uniref:YcaO-like family protein n=1 Tax=Pseudonocardia sp. T1-2H TaxID=3128899 RepID=UPI0031018835